MGSLDRDFNATNCGLPLDGAWSNTVLATKVLATKGCQRSKDSKLPREKHPLALQSYPQPRGCSCCSGCQNKAGRRGSLEPERATIEGRVQRLQNIMAGHVVKKSSHKAESEMCSQGHLHVDHMAWIELSLCPWCLLLEHIRGGGGVEFGAGRALPALVQRLQIQLSRSDQGRLESIVGSAAKTPALVVDISSSELLGKATHGRR